MGCPCLAQGRCSHQWTFYSPQRAGSWRGVWGAPEQPGPPCWRPESHSAHPGRVSGQASAERWHSSSISHDDPSHRSAAGMKKMASGEQHAECQRLATGPGDRAGPPTTSRHLHTSTPLQHPTGHGAPWALPQHTVETVLSQGRGKATLRAAVLLAQPGAPEPAWLQRHLCPGAGFLGGCLLHGGAPTAKHLPGGAPGAG